MLPEMSRPPAWAAFQADANAFLSALFAPILSRAMPYPETIPIATPVAVPADDGGVRLTLPVDPWYPGEPWVNHRATHFCPVSFGPPMRRGEDPEGPLVYRRQLQWMRNIWGVMQDDVFEKCDPLPLRPTAVIETKPGSEQRLYMLTDPMEERDRSFVHHALMLGGWNDPKGGDNAVRLCRLPGSVKPGAGAAHRAVLRHFAPEVRHDPLDVLLTLAASLSAADRAKATALADREFGPLLPEDQALNFDPVFRHLHDTGQLLAPPRRGWWPVECPFPEDHRDAGQIHDAAYYPGKDGKGCFNCFRGDRHVRTRARAAGYRSETHMYLSLKHEEARRRAENVLAASGMPHDQTKPKGKPHAIHRTPDLGRAGLFDRNRPR